MAVDPFGHFLANVGGAPNETAKRELFVALAATGFGEHGFATELALGAEHRVEFERSGAVRRGRVDSFFGSLVIEFESDLVATHAHALDQLREYVAGAWREDETTDRAYLAVASDGLRWEVFSPRLAALPVDSTNVVLDLIDQWHPEGMGEDAPSLRDFLNRLFFRRLLIAPTAANFARDFGLGSPAFLHASQELTQKLNELGGNTSLRVKRVAWHESLQVAYGSVETDDDLFAKHTYLAVLARLLVWAALERRHLDQPELDAVLNGTYFVGKRIANLVEDDFFRWHEAPSAFDSRRTWVALSRHLAGYDLTTVREDVLKPLYEDLVDPATRQVLGEYYTPDWLASQVTEHLLSGWDWTHGSPRVIDPAAGSGTFLRTTIEWVRRGIGTTGVGDPLDTILDSVVGIDVHPLAVTISRATYLLAIKDLVTPTGPMVTIPVFLANSLQRPDPGNPTLFEAEVTRLNIATRSYDVPVDFVRDGRRYDATVDDLVSVARAYGAPGTDLQDIPASLTARLGDRLADFPLPEQLLQTVIHMASDLAVLIREDADSVYGFMLKNNLRPEMLRHSFDYVVGNPPWLTVGDIATEEYQKLVVDLATAANIAPRRVGEQAHTELATIFLAGAATELLRPNSPATGRRIGLVMPRSLFAATHHRLLRTGAYLADFRVAELWDLDAVTPLFQVPSCVLFAAFGPATPRAPIPGREYRGRLRAKDLPWAEAQPSLEIDGAAAYRLAFLGGHSAWVRIGAEGDTVGTFGPTAGANSYETAFRQGAILYPQTILTVTGDGTNLRRGMGSVVVRTDPRARRNAKLLPDLDIRRPVDSASLFLTAIAEHLVPFALLDPLWTVVLPTTTDPGNADFGPTDSAALRRAGRIDTAAWLDWAEGEWRGVRRTEETIDLHVRLDHLHHLSAQASRNRFLVLFTSSAARPVAATLDTERLNLPFVARDKTYWASFDSIEEADFLTAFLNSKWVADRIEAWQTRGLFGTRDIHKRPLAIAWPAFNLDDEGHAELSRISARLRDAADLATVNVAARGIGRMRTQVRENLPADEMAAVEDLVARISTRRAADLVDTIGNAAAGA